MPRLSLPSSLRCLRRVGIASLLAAVACVYAGPPAPAPAWAAYLSERLQGLERDQSVEVGVHVRDLATAEVFSHRGEDRWYLASMVKVPVAIAVLRGVQERRFTLDTPLRLKASDYVDGAGRTNQHPVGTPLPVRFLMEQMIIHSDNTATDLLIALVGLHAVHAVVAELVPGGFGPITTLADVRRHTYGQLTPAARQLAGTQLLELRRQASDTDRLHTLARLVGTPVRHFRLPTVEAAYQAYYASGYNAASLEAYGELLAQVAAGRALAPASTAYLLELMERVATGAGRIRAGLPPGLRFAHKTGTQRRRVCDAGLVRGTGEEAGPGVVLVACVRGELSLRRSERALREVGLAVCESGVLLARMAGGGLHANPCPLPARAGRAAGPVRPGHP